MELPQRPKGDQLLQPGEFRDLRRRLSRLAPANDLTSVIACAFDERTHMLPFHFADRRMAPAGVRAIGSALYDAGFRKTRIVLKAWNMRFQPSRMRVDGRIPDLFCVSSLAIHGGDFDAMVADACRLPPHLRPLIVGGGPLVVYEPWSVFGENASVDVAVKGEEPVFLALLEAVLSERAAGESLRAAFCRARDSGALDGIPGLVYARTDADGRPVELVDTGTQRLLGDLDELPHPAIGYRLLEPPSRASTLARLPLPPSRVRKNSPIASLVLTFGCKFRCPYCTIPAYNQLRFRTKSPERIVDEMRAMHQMYGHRYFFGTDDNFFNDKDRTIAITSAIAAALRDGKSFRYSIRWGTEATVHDTLQIGDELDVVRASCLRALWMGVEDMTGTLVKKGQTGDKTLEAFRLLVKRGIHPMPMMMHHDGQPLFTRKSNYGLINQVQALRDAGAVNCQVLVLSPAAGSKLYDGTYRSGMAFETVGGEPIARHRQDGNFVIASNAASPWRQQVNLLLAYLWFYNPLRMVLALVRPKSRMYLVDVFLQVAGMIALVPTIGHMLSWAWRLRRHEIARASEPPASRLPIVQLENSTEKRAPQSGHGAA